MKKKAGEAGNKMGNRNRERAQKEEHEGKQYKEKERQQWGFILQLYELYTIKW
jgi:hypothetical protein